MKSEQAAIELEQLESELVELKAEYDRFVAAYPADPTDKAGKAVVALRDKIELLELRIKAKRAEHAAALEAEAAESHDAALAALMGDLDLISSEAFRVRTADRVRRLVEAERVAEELWQELAAEACQHQTTRHELARRAAELDAPEVPEVFYANEIGLDAPHDVQSLLIGLRSRQRDIEARLGHFASQVTLGRLCPRGSNDEIANMHAELRALQRRLWHLIVPAPVVDEDTPKQQAAEFRDFMSRLGLRCPS